MVTYLSVFVGQPWAGGWLGSGGRVSWVGFPLSTSCCSPAFRSRSRVWAAAASSVYLVVSWFSSRSVHFRCLFCLVMSVCFGPCACNQSMNRSTEYRIPGNRQDNTPPRTIFEGGFLDTPSLLCISWDRLQFGLRTVTPFSFYFLFLYPPADG